MPRLGQTICNNLEKLRLPRPIESGEDGKTWYAVPDNVIDRLIRL